MHRSLSLVLFLLTLGCGGANKWGETGSAAPADTDSGTDSDSDTSDDDDDDDEAGEDATQAGATVLSDEEDAGGGDDGWRPSSTLLLDCEWLAQSPPGDWNNTVNCGPVALLMAESCLSDFAPTSNDTIALIDWMDDNISTYGGVGTNHNGSLTSTSQLSEAWSGYFARGAERRPGATLESVYDELADGRPVIITTLTQASNHAPSDVMALTGAPHFMLVVGLTPTHVVLHDPGRSQSANGEARYYTIESFHQTWGLQGNAALFFEGSTSVDGELSSCSVDGEDLTVEGWVSSDADIELWSITVDTSGALEGGEPAGSSDTFSRTIDVSAYADDAQHTAALWVKPEGADGGTRVDTCDFTVTSSSGSGDEDCGNGVDDDTDGLVDCDDDECIGDASCTPTLSSTICDTYERGASATCVTTGTHFVTGGSFYIGCLSGAVSTIDSDTQVTTTGSWNCSCALAAEDTAYRHPGGSSSCGTSTKVCSTVAETTVEGDLVLDSVSPSSVAGGSTDSFTFAGCNLCTSSGTVYTHISNISLSGATCTNPAVADEVTASGAVQSSAGVKDCAVARAPGLSCSDSGKDCVTSCVTIY